MRRIISVLAVMAIVAAMVAVMAMPAFAEAQGKGPGACVAPGVLFSQTAKVEGPNNEFFPDLSPGQLVKVQCTPAVS